MAKTIAIVNQKGGVGKTTTCVNLAAALKALGSRVLVCDFDPQANTTSGFGVDKVAASPNIYDVLVNDADITKAIVHTDYADVLPTNKALTGATVEMIAMDRREYRLKDALSKVAGDYDYIFIDCPPSLELLTLNALCAADSILVPVQCEYYALEGLSDLLSTVRIVKRALNPDIAMEGVVLTMGAPTSRSRWPKRSSAISPDRSTPPSSPATYGSPRPPATGSPCRPTTAFPAGRRPMPPWPRRSWTRTAPEAHIT